MIEVFMVFGMEAVAVGSIAFYVVPRAIESKRAILKKIKKVTSGKVTV